MGQDFSYLPILEEIPFDAGKIIVGGSSNVAFNDRLVAFCDSVFYGPAGHSA